MKLEEIKAAVTHSDKELRMPRHEAVALLREHNYDNAAARRKQVHEWILEVRPKHTVDSIHKDFMNRRISKRLAVVRLGRCEEFCDNPFTLVKLWRQDRNSVK